ncbi:Putative high light inducible protein (modular protein) [Cyanobium sp. NIES-981]|nr:Putative high light inducible protein (modular protein) [Cyanobium sp. NIES-981]
MVREAIGDRFAALLFVQAGDSGPIPTISSAEMIVMTQATQPKKVRNYAESEGGMWDSEDSQLLDPKVIEPKMYRASAESDSGWGFHRRAELLNGRLAMLGFVIGVLVEAVSGQGILQQIGLGALLR